MYTCEGPQLGYVHSSGSDTKSVNISVTVEPLSMSATRNLRGTSTHQVLEGSRLNTCNYIKQLQHKHPQHKHPQHKKL